MSPEYCAVLCTYQQSEICTFEEHMLAVGIFYSLFGTLKVEHKVVLATFGLFLLLSLVR